MDCNYKQKLLSQLTPKEKERLLKTLDKFNQEYLDKESQAARVIITDNLLKLIIVVLHEKFRFGSIRIQRMLNDLNDLVCENNTDDIFFENIKNKCIKIMREDVFNTYFNKKDDDLSTV